MNAFGDGPTVLRLKRHGAQDQQVQCSLWKVDAGVRHLLPYHFYREHTLPLVEVQGGR